MKKNLIFLLIATFFALQVQSQTSEAFSVDIPNAESIYAAQKQTNWCWAACNQMLLSAKGIRITQENQSVKLFGRVVNQGAGTNYELAKGALGGTYTKSSGSSVRIVPYVSYLSQRNANDPLVIINHLNAGIPLVMATSQHGRVCVGVDYLKNGNYYQITKLRLLDPFVSSSIIEYSMQQFLQEGLMGFMTYDVR